MMATKLMKNPRAQFQKQHKRNQNCSLTSKGMGWSSFGI